MLNPRAQVGEVLQAVYRVDNDTRWAKPWVELWNDSTLPAPLPGRAIGVRAQGSRQWLAKVTLVRRGSYRLGALRVRTGDPFGLFSSEMLVGQATWVVVFPKVHQLPNWRLPPSPVDGTSPAKRRLEAATPLVSTIRPYVYGDAINRIHWLSSRTARRAARQGVRPRADGRPVAAAGPGPRRRMPARAMARRSRPRSAPPPRSRCRPSAPTGRSASPSRRAASTC